MRSITVLLLLICFSSLLLAQSTQDSIAYSQNTAMRMMNNQNRLTVGGYAQIDYNQPISSDTRQNGKLDVHRLVMLFGYKFDAKTQFITEIEYEHVSEVFVEQAFLQHKINNYFNFRAGLMLIPMGIINEYHEPPTYRGVERPNVDKYIVPTTWRELGAGFTGRFDDLSLRYQAYLFTGFKSYQDGAGLLDGQNGLRKGRQKGAESFASSPNLSFKFDYYGISSLKLGFSGYFGDTQSTLYNGIDRNDEAALLQADSSVVGVNMIGLDARYQVKGFLIRGQYIFNKLNNTNQYNTFTGKDVGSQHTGFFAEVGYDVFNRIRSIKSQLIPFVRYEQYNTHQATEEMSVNDAFHRTEITAGIDWKITPGTVLKADFQWLKNRQTNVFNHQLNLGVGVWFN